MHLQSFHNAVFSEPDLINGPVSPETSNRLINGELNSLILSRDIKFANC